MQAESGLDRIHTVKCRPGVYELLADVLEAAGLNWESACGKTGTCGKCRIMVLDGLTRPPSEEETAFLTRDDLNRGIRLACCCLVAGQVSVRLEEAVSPAQILTTGLQADFRIDPIEGRLHRPSSAEPCTHGYGVAADIGTTTVVAVLIDLANGNQLAVASALNPQTRFGLDVLSRIHFAQKEESGLSRLQQAITGCLNGLIDQLCAASGLSSQNISELAVGANTVMLHLLLGIDPASIGRAPYTPAFLQAQTVPAARLGIQAAPAGRVYCLPAVSGFVGADIVGGIVAAGLHRTGETVLFLDLGTNGEMVLFRDGRPVACSTAAGPALEGMNIACGMRAADGAVEAVWLRDDGSLAWRTIGNKPPRGLCGSGLLDLVAALREAGIIAPSGRFVDPQRLPASGEAPQETDNLAASPLAGHLEEQGGRRRFRLALPAEFQTPPELSCSTGPGSEPTGSRAAPASTSTFSPADYAKGAGVYLTQADVRQVQVAKSAIATGIKVLLAKSGLAGHEVERVLLAGAFGAYLNPDTLVRLGFFPATWRGRMEFAGNTALAGAAMALLSSEARKHMENFVPRVECVRLETEPGFEKLFVGNMELGVNRQ